VGPSSDRVWFYYTSRNFTNEYYMAGPDRNSGCGRPFSSGSALVNLILNGALYGDRLNQVDLRFTKILNVGRRGSVDLDVELYNGFNSDAILSQQDNYGVAWQNATSVIQPRFVKFQVRWDF